MKNCLGLFALLTLLPLTGLCASGALILRGHIEPSFKVDVSSGTPRLLSNVKGEAVRPQLKVEKQGNGFKLIVIHP